MLFVYNLITTCVQFDDISALYCGEVCLTADEEYGMIGFIGADLPGGNGSVWSFSGFINIDAIL